LIVLPTLLAGDTPAEVVEMIVEEVVNQTPAVEAAYEEAAPAPAAAAAEPAPATQEPAADEDTPPPAPEDTPTATEEAKAEAPTAQ
jgi:hypothetical protein